MRIFLIVAVLLSFSVLQAKQQAIGLFSSGQYEAAHERLQKLFVKNMADAEISFYLGRAAFELGQYDRAIAAFERVLILEPNNLRARLELGRSYYAAGMLSEAEAQFKRVLQNPLPAQVRDNVLRYLAQIEQGRRKHFYSGSIGAGLGHDSNVKNGNSAPTSVLVDGFGTVDLGNINPEEASSLWQLFGGFSHRYDPKNDRFQWQSNAQLFMQGYPDADDADVRLFSVSTGPLFNRGAWAFSLPLGVEHLNYAGENYLLSPSIGVRADHAMAAGRMMSYEYRLQKKQNQISANEDRDATAHTLSVNHQRLAQEGKGVLSVGGSLALNRKDSGDQRDVSSDALQLRAGYFTRLSSRLTLNLGGAIKQTTYPDKPPKVSDAALPFHERKDTALSLNAALGWQLKEQLFVQGNLGWIDNDSNDAFYDYDKQVLNLNLLRTF